MNPTPAELRQELRWLSTLLYGAIGQGGLIGPSMAQYDLHRPDFWPRACTLVRRMPGCTPKPTWTLLLASVGLRGPTVGEARRANQRLFPSPPELAMDAARLARIASYGDGHMAGRIVGRCIWTKQGWRTGKEYER